MSGAGFRGRGSAPRGRNLRGMGLMPGGDPGIPGPRNPQPNFNQPRRDGHGPPPDFWLEHPGSAPWPQMELHHPHSQYSGYDPYRYNRGRPQYCPGIRVRGRGNRIRGDGRPRGIYQLGGYQPMGIARPPLPAEPPKFPPLGSEEERQQKIAETADKLKQKLSSLTVEEPVNFWVDNLLGEPFPNDDQEQHLVSNRGIPELRHDPPELNLTVGDFKDIGRVDPDCFANSGDAQEVAIIENEQPRAGAGHDNRGEDGGTVGSDVYLLENNEGTGNGSHTTERPNCETKEPERSGTDQPVVEQLNYASNYEKVSTPEPVESEKEVSKAEDKEPASSHNPELSESLEKLRKVIKIDRELEKGRAALHSDNRPVFKPSLNFRPEINPGYPRFQECGNSKEPRDTRSRFREEFRPENPRDNFRPDFNPRYDSGPRNFNPQRAQGSRMNHSEFGGQGQPRMNRSFGRPIDHCDRDTQLGFDPRGLPPRFNNFRQDQPGSNLFFNRSEMNHGANGLQPSPSFDPRGPPPLRFMSQKPELPVFGPNADFPILSMGYVPQIPHMHIGPGPYGSMVNGNYNPIMPPPNTAPFIIQDFLPQIPTKIDTQVLQPPPPPPPPPIDELDEIKLPVVAETEKPADSLNPTPNMNEELEDMQEALEFAKKLMNMTEEEADLLQSFNMPTFPDLPPIPSTEPSHLVDEAEVEAGDAAKGVESSEAREDEALVQEEEGEAQMLDDQTRTKVVFNVNSRCKVLPHSDHWPKQNEESSSSLGKKMREKLASLPIPLPKEKSKGSRSPCEEKRETRKNKPEESSAQEIPASRSPASGSKPSKSLLVSTVDANWKDKVINQFLKMSKNDICNMVNSSGLRKFDIAMKHLVKERKHSLSQERRTSADDAVKGAYDMSREEFMSQLSAMLDPSATVDVKNLPAKFIQHLSEVLKLDVESHLNEAENLPQENNDLLNSLNNGDKSFSVVTEPQNFAQFLQVDDVPEINMETGANSGHATPILTDFGNLLTTPEPVDQPMPNMQVLDDMFSEGIARAKPGLNTMLPDAQSPSEIEPEPIPLPYIRARCTKTLMIAQSENVDLDELFSAGIARASEAKVRSTERASELWGRKKCSDPDLFRNLTKEEWEAKCGSSRDAEPRTQGRTPSSRETSLGARSHSPRNTEPPRSQGPKNNRLNRNQSLLTTTVPKNPVEPTRETGAESCSDFGSSLSSDGEPSAVPKVTKLLKVIKDREKIAKDLSLNETIRDEVTAEMERERGRVTEAERKLRKREKCLRRRERKERLERESREEPTVEIKQEDPVSIKQEELIIEADHEKFLETGSSGLEAQRLKVRPRLAVDKNKETSLSAILLQENNDNGNLKSREMLVAREYAGRRETQEVQIKVGQNLAPETKRNDSSVLKPAPNHSSEKSKPKKTPIAGAEKITGKIGAKKIVGGREMQEIRKNSVLETIRDESPVQKLAQNHRLEKTDTKEAGHAVPKITTCKSGAKKIASGPETLEVRENLVPETTRNESLVEKPVQNNKFEPKDAAEVPGGKAGTKKIDINVYKARKLQRNYGKREKPKEAAESPSNIQTSERVAEKGKLAEDSKTASTEELQEKKGTENSEPGSKTEALEDRKVSQVTKPENREEKKLGKEAAPKADKKSDKSKGGNNEKVDKRRSRETERSKSREDSRRNSRDKSKRASQESSHAVKRQDKTEVRDKSHQNNNVIQRRDEKATKYDRDVDSSKATDEKIEKQQASDNKRNCEDDKLKDEESIGEKKDNEATEIKEIEEAPRQEVVEEVEKVPALKEAEDTEEVLKQNVAEKKEEAETTEEVTGAKEIEETPKQEEAKEMGERVKISERVEVGAEILVQNKEPNTEKSSERKETEESTLRDTETEKNVEVSVPESHDSATSIKLAETEEDLPPQEENAAELAIEATIPEAESDLEKLEKDSSDKQDDNGIKNLNLIHEETPKPLIPDNNLETRSEIDRNETLGSSKATTKSDNDVESLLNELIEKAISQLGLLNAGKTHAEEETKQTANVLEEIEETAEAPSNLKESGEALSLDSEELVTEKPEETPAVGGSSPHTGADFGTEPDSTSPRRPESPLKGFSEETINCSILGKRRLAQSVLEITENFVANKRAKNFDDIMRDMIAESASIPDELREQISQDRDLEKESKIEEEIDKLIPNDLGAGCLTPSGDTLSLGSSIDFDQGEFIVLSEISSDENFSQNKTLRPIVDDEIKQAEESVEPQHEKKLEEESEGKQNSEETDSALKEKLDKTNVENSEVEFTVSQVDRPAIEHPGDGLSLEEAEDLIEPLDMELVVEKERVEVAKEAEIKTPKIENRPEETAKKDSRAVSPSNEKGSSRNLHRVKHKHKTKHKKDKKYKISEKKVKEVSRDENLVTLVKKQQSKEVVMARMIEIDIEIHKLMSEKLRLYHMLESGEFPAEQCPTVKEKVVEAAPASHEARALPSRQKTTSSKTVSSEPRRDNGEKEPSLVKRSKKPQRHSEPRKSTVEKPSDGRTSVSKKKHGAEDKSASTRSSPNQRKEDNARKNVAKDSASPEEANAAEVSAKSKKTEHHSAQRRKGREDPARKIGKKEEAESPSEPANNALQAQQIYSDESSQVSVSSQHEIGKAGNKKGLKGLALLEESYKREKAISKKHRGNVSRGTRKEELPKSQKQGSAFLTSEEDMPLDLLYVKKFRKRVPGPQKNAEIKRTRSTEIPDHVLEVINAVAENKIEEYQRSNKVKPEPEALREKVSSKSRANLEETQAAWHLEETGEQRENFICDDDRLGEVKNLDNSEPTKCPVEEGGSFSMNGIEEKNDNLDTNRSDRTESLNQLSYDEIPDIDESFVKIEVDRCLDVLHPMVEIHTCDPDALSVASSSAVKRRNRKRRNSGDDNWSLKKLGVAKSEIKKCSVRLVDCKYTHLQNSKDRKTPPQQLEDRSGPPLAEERLLTPEPELIYENTEEYDEDDLEIIRIHALSSAMSEDEVVQDFCSLEPESLRTLDETEVDQEFMEMTVVSGGSETCPKLPTTEISVFEEPTDVGEPVSEFVNLDVSEETKEANSHTSEEDIRIVAKSPSTDEDNDDVQEVELPRVQYSVHKGPILDVKVFGDSILAASEDGVIYRYSQTCNGILNTYEGHRSAVTCIYVLQSVSSSGTTRDLLFSGSLDGSLRCYDITTSVQVRGAADVGSPIQCMDQSWGMIYLGTKSGYVFRFHIKSHAFRGDEIKFSEESVLALKATTEGPRRVLIVASRSQPITIRDARDGLFLRTVSGHKTHTVYSLMMDSNLVYCGTSSTAIPVFDFINGSQVKMYNAGPGVVCMRMYKWLLFAGCYDGNIYVFDTREQKLVCSIPGPGNMLLSMDIVKNKIVAGSKDRRLHMWRMPDQVLSLLSKRNNVT